MAPIASAASTTPLSISRNPISTNRAKNGDEAMIKAGNAAFGPVIEPTRVLVTGSNNTIKIINGIERKTLTKIATTL